MREWRAALSASEFRDVAGAFRERAEGLTTAQQLLDSKTTEPVSDATQPFDIERIRAQIRTLQNEIEQQNSNCEHSVELLQRLRRVIESTSTFSQKCTSVINYFGDFTRKSEIVQELRDGLDTIRISDELIACLEAQVESVRKKTELEIQTYQDNNNAFTEIHKSKEITQIMNDIEQIEEQKSVLSGLISKLHDEVSNAENSINKLGEMDKDNLEEYNQRKNEIEERLNDINQKLEYYQSHDFSSKIQEKENALYQLKCNIQEKEKGYKFLEKEIRTLNDDKILSIEYEIKQLQTQQSQMENEITELPSIQEYNEVQSKLKLSEGKSPKALNSEIAYYETKNVDIEKEIREASFAHRQSQQIYQELTANLNEQRQRKESLNNACDDSLIISMLKEQKLDLVSRQTVSETRLQDLSKEEQSLEAQIQSLKDEKERLLEFLPDSTRRVASVGGANRKTKLDRVMMKFFKLCARHPWLSVVAVIYVLSLHFYLLSALLRR